MHDIEISRTRIQMHHHYRTWKVVEGKHMKRISIPDMWIWIFNEGHNFNWKLKTTLRNKQTNKCLETKMFARTWISISSYINRQNGPTFTSNRQLKNQLAHRTWRFLPSTACKKLKFVKSSILFLSFLCVYLLKSKNQKAFPSSGNGLLWHGMS